MQLVVAVRRDGQGGKACLTASGPYVATKKGERHRSDARDVRVRDARCDRTLNVNVMRDARRLGIVTASR